MIHDVRPPMLARGRTHKVVRLLKEGKSSTEVAAITGLTEKDVILRATQQRCYRNTPIPPWHEERIVAAYPVFTVAEISTLYAQHPDRIRDLLKKAGKI